MIDHYYHRLPPDGGYQLFESTAGTGSNWDATIQHGSPPLALMTKVIEELAGTGGLERSDRGNVTGGLERSDRGIDTAGLRIARLTLDILGAIPVAPVKVRAWVDRPGARVSLMMAEMLASRTDGADRTVARVSAWLLATSDTTDAALDRHPPVVEGEAVPNPHAWIDAPGYLETVSWRKQKTVGAADPVVWLSPLVGLVDDEPLTDMQRLALVVDSANGVGAAMDPEEFIFMNTDTTVHLHRAPTGNDFALRARGSIGPDGIGATTAEIFDRRGFIGTSAQALLVQRR